MKFRLIEKFSKQFPNKIRTYLLQDKHILEYMITLGIDPATATCEEIDIHGEEGLDELGYSIEVILEQESNGETPSYMVFVIYDNVVLPIPYRYKLGHRDILDLIDEHREKVSSAYAVYSSTQTQKDLSRKQDEREINRAFHDDSAFHHAGQRYTYDGQPLSKNRTATGFDASGYLLKPVDYYEDKLLSYQRQDYAQALTNIYNKLTKSSDVIKSYIQTEVDFLDVDSTNTIRAILSSLNNANKYYNEIVQEIEKCKTEEELDEIFVSNGPFSKLNNLVRNLSSAIKDIQYTNFDW